MTTTTTSAPYVNGKPTAADILKAMQVQCPNTQIIAPSPYTPAIEKRDIFGLHEDMLIIANSMYDVDHITECAEAHEIGLAQWVGEVLAGNVVYDHSNAHYYYWNRLYYEEDPGEIMTRIASDITVAACKRASIDKYAEYANIVASLAGAEPDQATAKRMQQLKSQRDALLKAVKSMQKHSTIEKVLKLSRTRYQLGVSGDVWDADVTLLGVANGVISLTTGQPVQPSPEQFIRTVAPTPYIAGAKAPLWIKALTEIFDGNKEKVVYLQRFLGYALLGICYESMFLLWYGKHGRNGKEFILDRIIKAIGDILAGAIDRELFLKNKTTRGAGSANESMMSLRGRRIAWASENNEGRQLDLAAMKDLSGGHQMIARPNYGKEVRWQRTHTPIMLTNHLPHVNSQALAEWDRIRVLEFPLSFVNEPDPADPGQREKDAALGERIDVKELPGILNWLIEGGLDYRQNGLQEPAEVKRATAKYRQGEDTLGLFIKECCTINHAAKCKPIELYNVYKYWVDEAEFGKPLGKIKFFERIEEKGYKRVPVGGNRDEFSGIEPAP